MTPTPYAERRVVDTAGIVQTGLGIAGGKNVKVEIVSSDDAGCTYHVRWE